MKRSGFFRILFFLFFMTWLLLHLSCLRNDNFEQREILAAGASFPYPLYQSMFYEFQKKFSDIKINYQPIGSGGGIGQLRQQTIHIGATDMYLSDAYMKKMPAEVIHIPTCIGAVAISYNLDIDGSLRLSADVLARIFLGEIKKWNHPDIVAENPELMLPDMKITVVFRSDSSGTSYIFSDYLAGLHNRWDRLIGRSRRIHLPDGTGTMKNSGVLSQIRSIKGSIGYLELNYAHKYDLAVAYIQNKSGNYIEPNVHSISEAATITIPADTRVTITNTEAEFGYPITGFSWILFYKEQSYLNRREDDAKALITLIKWMIQDGQKYNGMLSYGNLPENVVNQALLLLKSVTYNGTSIY